MTSEQKLAYQDPESLVTISSRFRKFIAREVKDVLSGFDRHNVEKTEPETFPEEPYYLMMDESTGYSNNHNMSLSMSRKVRPTLRNLVDCCLDDRDDDKIFFQQGMFVEYQSKDMGWKVGVVNRVILQAPDDWDFKTGDFNEVEREVFYNVGFEGLLSKKDVRAPTKGLQYIFGKRPWLWQQFTMLKLEKRLRFDVDHEYDFEEFDCVEFATTSFNLWLEAEQNADFKALYDAQKDITKYLLRDNLFKPFRNMDDVVENQELWDIHKNPSFSVYTYLGVLDSGLAMAAMIFAIQILAPLVILYNVLFIAGDDINERFDIVYNDDFDIVSSNGNFLPTTDFETFCFNRNPRSEGAVLIVIVLLVYMATVVPQSFVVFYRVSGNADTSFSRATSMMQSIFEQDDLDLWQLIGFKMDRLMNTGYYAMLYTIMLFILIQTPNILDIILNALAIDFIAEIDEKVVAATWFDYKKRYLRAGIMELMIRKTLRLNLMKKPAEFCRLFSIDQDAYDKALDGRKPLYNPVIAKTDDSNPLYMTRKERVYEIVARKAQEGGYPFILAEYRKIVEDFGTGDKIVRKLGFKQSGIFHRFTCYRVWSRWEKILFLPTLPDISQDIEENKAKDDDLLSTSINTAKSDESEFTTHVLLVILGIDLVSTIALSIWRKNLRLIPAKFFFGILEIIFYFFQLMFPVLVLLALFFAPYCY